MRRTIGSIVVVLLGTLTLTSYGLAVQQSGQKKFPAPQMAAATNFAGTWVGTYQSSEVGATRVTLIFQQRGSTVTGTYLSANGAQGVMYGTVAAGSNTLTAKAEQTTPTCTGQFEMSAAVSGGTLTWSFKGQDCLGVEDGQGKASRSSKSR
jgi:hypothetical protein